MCASTEKPCIEKTFLTYKLTSRQNALLNYFIPSITSLFLYILLFASDVALVFRHYKDENPIWGSLSVFIIYFPALIAYIVTISSWELWPDMQGCERDNCVWFIVKTQEHLFFPIWAMWRYAERIFWSIEAIRSTDDKFIASAIDIISAPRTIELYFFLQAFLHSLPQMLVQLNILMRQDYDINKQTADAEVLSLIFHLTKVAATVAFYQRFKSQKLAGKQYPWFKTYKQNFDQVDSRSKVKLVEKRPLSSTTEIHSKRPLSSTIEEPEQRPLSSATEEPAPSESRRSSDFYMEPELREVLFTLRETSVVDGPNREVFREVSEPDFNIRRLVNVKGLPEDDLAGKLVSFFWWFCFLLARILAISCFFYFYPRATVSLLVAHFCIVITFLMYDVKSDDVKRGKALFFIFIGVIYIFCIIEFKIRFKKVTFMYCGYFSLVFIQNFIMCMIWWFNNIDDLRNDFWFRYMFYIILWFSMLSVPSMLLYMNIIKPKKVVVGQKLLQ